MQEKESFKRIVRLSLSGVCLLGQAAIYVYFLYEYYFEPIKLNLRFFEKGEALFIAIYLVLIFFFSSMYGQRNSCFHCRYTSYKRPSDFTIGDFWNLENAGISFDTTKGVNALLVNTDKGRELFEKLRTHAKVQPVSKQACWQAHLEYSSKQPAKQEQFWKEYSEAEDKEEILKRYMKGSLTTRIIRKLSPVLQKTGLYGLAGKLYKVVFVGNKNE